MECPIYRAEYNRKYAEWSKKYYSDPVKKEKLKAYHRKKKAEYRRKFPEREKRGKWKRNYGEYAELAKTLWYFRKEYIALTKKEKKNEPNKRKPKE